MTTTTTTTTASTTTEAENLFPFNSYGVSSVVDDDGNMRVRINNPNIHCYDYHIDELTQNQVWEIIQYLVIIFIIVKDFICAFFECRRDQPQHNVV